MKTFTIGWLNKCRCGNKSHTVKTARGNETALWDDDAVKCNSCGRGGVIQVCEGQARVLWETDQEMAEGKPMSTITRELAKLFRKITNSEIDAEGNAHVVLSPADSLLINNARIALASLEAEAVGEVVLGEYDDCGCHPDAKVVCIAADGQADWENFKDGTRLYTAPPAPVSVPAAMEMDDDFDSAFEHGKAVGWNAYRAAMLQSFGNSEQLNSPVIPDCWCRTCRPITLRDMRFVVCPECGNKRCPHANDHRNACTGSNEPGQEGSAYPATPQQEISHALAKGMERYGDAMQKLADSGD